jgi:hypothetical protein
MFAMSQLPPSQVRAAGALYRLVRVYKHDFFAATCLYERCEPSGGWPPPRVVVKFMRKEQFCGIGGRWLGRLLAGHEQAIYERLTGLAGVPRWVQRIDETTIAIEHLAATPLDHAPPPAGFFDRLRDLLREVHARGVGYCDMNKRSNILVGPGGEPFLIDYQISIRSLDDWPWPVRAMAARLVRYVQNRDVYHLYKHKRRISPRELTPQEAELSRRLTALHRLHRLLTDPWRRVRRAFLRSRHRKGALVSPTGSLEDHDQPEKRTWRN